MFTLADADRLRVRQYAAWCKAYFLELEGGAVGITPPAAHGILAEKQGLFVTFALAGKTLYAAGILLPEAALSKSMETVYRKAAALLPNRAEGVADALKIISRPRLCEAIEHIDLARHGIMLFARGRSHYLLPGAALRNGWSRIGALEQLCRRLALPPGIWRDRSARLMTFEAVDI